MQTVEGKVHVISSCIYVYSNVIVNTVQNLMLSQTDIKRRSSERESPAFLTGEKLMRERAERGRERERH